MGRLNSAVFLSLINGEVFDNYAPATTNVRNIASNIEAKVMSGQTNNVVINLADSSVTATALQAQITNYPILGLKQVIIIDKSGNFSLIKWQGSNMSMNLFCYSSKTANEVSEIIDFFSKQHKDIFTEKFLISDVRKAGAIQKEIALEYGLHANTIFLVRYNDKLAIGLSSNVIEIIKSSLGINAVVILFENEILR